MSKFRILSFHGYRQNGTVFSNQTGSLRKILKKEAEFFYLTAPNKVPYEPGDSGDDQDPRAWWLSRPDGFSSRDVSDNDQGLSETLKLIKSYFEEHGPFHGVLGFSQGAALVGMLCGMKQKHEFNLDFQFAIIVSGFKSKCTLHSNLYSDKININSLHIIGETDEVIPVDMSIELAEVFNNPSIVRHPGGHFVPGRSSMKQKFVDFLTAQTTDEKDSKE